MAERKAPHVWIIDQNTMTPDIPGGTRHWEIGRRLVADGVSAEVWASDFHISRHAYLHLRFPRLWKLEDHEGLGWCWLWSTPYRRNDWKRVLNQLSFAGMVFLRGLFRRRPKLVYGSTPQLPVAYAAYLAARIRRIPFVLEVRDLWPQVLIDMGGKSPDSASVRFLASLERRLYRGASRVVVAAPGAVDYVAERGADRDRVLLAPNGTRPPDLSGLPTVSEARRTEGLPADKFVVAYTGAHGTANSLHTLVEAAAELQRTDPGRFLVLLVGDGMEKPALLERAAGNPAMELRDPVPKTELPMLLHGCDALALTLLDVPVFRYGVAPRKLCDYYAASKPVVVNVAGAVSAEVEEHGCGVTAPPEDSAALADAIRRLAAATPEERAAMGARGRALVEDRYDSGKVAARISAALCEDLGLSPKSAP